MYMSELASAHFQFYVQFLEFRKTCSPNAVCYIEHPKNSPLWWKQVYPQVSNKVEAK